MQEEFCLEFKGDVYSYKKCFKRVDGRDLPHGPQKTINSNGVVVVLELFNEGKQVGFLVNRDNAGAVVRVCYFDDDQPDCIDLVQ